MKQIDGRHVLGGEIPVTIIVSYDRIYSVHGLSVERGEIFAPIGDEK